MGRARTDYDVMTCTAMFYYHITWLQLSNDIVSCISIGFRFENLMVFVLIHVNTAWRKWKTHGFL